MWIREPENASDAEREDIKRFVRESRDKWGNEDEPSTEEKLNEALETISRVEALAEKIENEVNESLASALVQKSRGQTALASARASLSKTARDIRKALRGK